MTVELKAFVTRTLMDILNGVSDAEGDKTVGKHIAPWGIGGVQHKGNAVATPRGPLIAVKFDVAVTAESSDTTKAEGGFKVAVLGIGASAGADLGTASKNVASRGCSSRSRCSASGRRKVDTSSYLTGRSNAGRCLCNRV